MKFSSFRDVWRSRKLSLLHHAVPKNCNPRYFLQQAFLVALDLLLKDELLMSSGANSVASKSRSVSSNSSPSSSEPVTPALHGYRIGPGSLPFQIGALYSMYCLHGTQLFRSRVPIRVSPQGMLTLIHLHRRLKSAGPLASDARAVLARLILDENNCTLQPTSCPGPATISFVDSTIPLTTKPEARAKQIKEVEREKAMTVEAKVAANRALSKEARSTDLPRPRTGDATGSLLDRVKKLSRIYEEYEAMLERSRGGGDRASSDGGDMIAGESGKSPSHRSQRFRQDLERILECGIDEATAVNTHGLALLAQRPPLAAAVPTSPNADSLLSLRLPELPELPPRVNALARVGNKKPDGTETRAVGCRGRAQQVMVGSDELIEGESGRSDSGGTASGNDGIFSGSGGNVNGSVSGGTGIGSGTNKDGAGYGNGDTVMDSGGNGNGNRSDGSSTGRYDSGGTGLRTIGRIGVRDHLRLVAKSLQEAEGGGNDGEGASVSRRGTSGIDGAGVQRDGRRNTWSNSSAVNGTAAVGIVKPPAGLGNGPRIQCGEGSGAVKLPGGLGNSSRSRGEGGDVARQNSRDNRVEGGKGKQKHLDRTESRDGSTKADEVPEVGTSPSDMWSSSEDEDGGETKSWDGLKDVEAFADSVATCTRTSRAVVRSSRASSRRPGGTLSGGKRCNEDGGDANSDVEVDSLVDSSPPPTARKGGRNTSAAISSVAAFGGEPQGQKPRPETASSGSGRGRGRGRGRPRKNPAVAVAEVGGVEGSSINTDDQRARVAASPRRRGRGRACGRGRSSRKQPNPTVSKPTDDLASRGAKRARLSTFETSSLLNGEVKRGVKDGRGHGRKRKSSSAAVAATDVEEKESGEGDGDDDSEDDPRVASLFNFAAELESSSLVPPGGVANKKKKHRLHDHGSPARSKISDIDFTKAAKRTNNPSRKTPAKSRLTTQPDDSGSFDKSKEQNTTNLGPFSSNLTTAVESAKASEDSIPKPSTVAAAASSSSDKSSAKLMGRAGPRSVQPGTVKGVNSIGGDTSSDSGSDDDGMGNSVSSRGKRGVGGGPSDAGSCKSIGDAGEQNAKGNAIGEEEAQQAKKEVR